MEIPKKMPILSKILEIPNNIISYIIELLFYRPIPARVYVYVYLCVCMCVCVRVCSVPRTPMCERIR